MPPLTPLSSATLNTKLQQPSISPSPFSKISLLDMEENIDMATPIKTQETIAVQYEEDQIDWDDGPSSPFVTELAPSDTASRKSSGADMTNMTIDLTPSRQLRMESEPFYICEDETSMPTPQQQQCQIDSTILVSPSRRVEAVQTQHVVMQETEDIEEEGDVTIDDTCFSAFSEVPNLDMTRFARIGQSPFKTSTMDQTPRPRSKGSISATPTPRANTIAYTDNDTTNLLLDFTQQFEAISTVSRRLSSMTRRSPTKTHNGEPQLLSYLQNQRSPRKSAAPSTPLKNNQNILNLLDFELPPAPTPRSIPTISIRELESLKSSYASQISSLKATLSGREAEVEALKRAVSDAERRVGESAEGAREEKAKREYVEREKEEWERRGREFESVLKKVKAEVLESEKERTELAGRAEDAEERLREMESKLADAEARAARAESSRITVESTTPALDGSSGPLYTAEQVQKQIDEKVHALSTELHAIYKKKHLTKVAGLKKGFEAKTKEKTTELTTRLEELERQNEELQAKLDATFSGVLPQTLVSGVSDEQRDADRKKLEDQASLIERQKAELAGRDEELKTRLDEFNKVMIDLERERVEKGELVAAVDEMLALQADMSVLSASVSENAAPGAVEDVLRKSVGLTGARPASGLARPGFGFAAGSRIGQPGGSGLVRPGVGKSRMMSNIERMGSGRLAE